MKLEKDGVIRHAQGEKLQKKLIEQGFKPVEKKQEGVKKEAK